MGSPVKIPVMIETFSSLCRSTQELNFKFYLSLSAKAYSYHLGYPKLDSRSQSGCARQYLPSGWVWNSPDGLAWLLHVTWGTAGPGSFLEVEDM